MSKKQLLRIYTLHRFLAAKKRIPTSQLCKRIEVSRATLFRDIDILKSIGAPVSYCYLTRIHQYTAEFELTLEELVEKI